MELRFGELCACARTYIQAEVRRQLGRDDVVPGMIAAIQTWGMLIKRVYEIDPLACPRCAITAGEWQEY